MSSESPSIKGVHGRSRESYPAGDNSMTMNDHEYAAKRMRLHVDEEVDKKDDDREVTDEIEDFEDCLEAGDDQRPEMRSDPHVYKTFKVSEKEASITEYLGEHRGFSGEIKQRYSDFIVHEIDSSGQLVKLTDTNKPEESKLVDHRTGSTTPLFSPEIHQKLSELCMNRDGETVEIPVEGLQKEERTEIHRYVKEKFTGLESNYSEKNGTKVILVMRKGNQARYSCDWPVGKPNFVYFVLYQENHGTIEAVEKIARLMGRPPKAFTYAGTKDKRSISSQRISSYRQNLDRLFNLNSILGDHTPAMMVGNITYNAEPIRLGQTSGNQFELVVRDLIYDKEDDVLLACQNVKEKGFINYFGTQRFGMSSSPSHSIGLAVLKQDWLSVLDMILMEKKIDPDSSKGDKFRSYNRCMKLWKETRNAELVLKELDSRNGREVRIMKGIIKSGSVHNYHAGFLEITRNQRMLYLHAYQSLLFNRLASFRIQRYGLQVVVGDLLITADDEIDQAADIKHIKPRVATENDVATFSIDDVVLPIFGVSSILPENDVAAKLHELLAEDGLEVNSFATKNKDLHLSGTYRKLLCKPRDLSMEIVSYDDNTIPLFQTDLDLLRNRESESTKGDKKALKLSFKLPTSTYATVMLREMMKTDVISV